MVRHKDFLLINVPDGAKDFSVYDVGTRNLPRLLYSIDTIGGKATLPPGTWQLIGLASELTEEQWREIVVGQYDEEDECWYYKDYKAINGELYPYQCADISGLSLLLFHDANPSTTVILKQIEV